MARGNLKRQALLKEKRKREKALLAEPKKQAAGSISAQIVIPRVFKEWLAPARYKIGYGGRGAGKSMSIAILLVLASLQKKLRILCCREFQSNIGQSVL